MFNLENVDKERKMDNFVIKQAASFAAALVAQTLAAANYPTVTFTGAYDLVDVPSALTIRFAANLNDIYFNIGTNYKAYLELYVNAGHVLSVGMHVFKDNDGDLVAQNHLMFLVPFDFNLLEANVLALTNLSRDIDNIMKHYVVADHIVEVNDGTLYISLMPWLYSLAMSQTSFNIKTTVPDMLQALSTDYEIPDSVALMDHDGAIRKAKPELPAEPEPYLGLASVQEEPKPRFSADPDEFENGRYSGNDEDDEPSEDVDDDDESFADDLPSDDWESEVDPDYYRALDLPSILSTFPDSEPAFVLARRFIPATPIYRGLLGIPNWLRNPETIVANSIQLQVMPLAASDIKAPPSKSEYMQDLYTGFVIELGDKFLVTVFKTTVTQPKGVSGLRMYSVRSYVFFANSWDVSETQLDLLKYANNWETTLEMVDQRTNAHVSKSILRATLSMLSRVATKAGWGAEYKAFEIGNPEQFWAQNRTSK
jgi:hypothetical protein